MIYFILYLILLAVVVFSALATGLVLAGLVAILWLKVPYAPTPRRHVDQIIDLFDLKPGQKFYDLGCGDGRFIAKATKLGAVSVGYEISPRVYWQTKIRLALANSQAKIVFKNFYQADLTDADAVFCFLIDKVMAKVENKLMAELKPGAKVICYGFALPTWPPEKIIDTNPAKPGSSKVYLYIK